MTLYRNFPSARCCAAASDGEGICELVQSDAADERASGGIVPPRFASAGCVMLRTTQPLLPSCVMLHKTQPLTHFLAWHPCRQRANQSSVPVSATTAVNLGQWKCLRSCRASFGWTATWSCALSRLPAPMSVRLWLMMAECWRCGTTIELTEEQEHQVELLLAEQSLPAAAPSLPSPDPAPPPRQQPGPSLVPEAQEAGWLPAKVRLRRALSETPAWLVSMLVHLLAFIVLALVTTEQKPPPGPFITLERPS